MHKFTIRAVHELNGDDVRVVVVWARKWAFAYVKILHFVDFRPAAEAAIVSNRIGAINTFLNWAKMISYLAYAPIFGLLIDTLALASGPLVGFFFVFVVVFIGFAQAHTMLLADKVKGYRTLSNAMYSLLLSLLGEFDFDELRVASPTMAPIMFLLFVVVTDWVMFTMIIAIISDSYAEARLDVCHRSRSAAMPSLGAW